MQNSDLGLPHASTIATVSSIPTFRHRNEFGEMVESTKPYPTVKAASTKYYVSTIANCSMHRPDGTRIGFVDGFFETDMLYTQDYLNGEIANGLSYIREATAEEVEDMKLRRDPRGTINNRMRAQLEPQLREELERDIASALADKIASGELDLTKLGGVDDISSKLRELRKTSTGAGSSSNGATVVSVTTPDVGRSFQASVVNSTTLAEGAADSSSGATVGVTASGLAGLRAAVKK